MDANGQGVAQDRLRKEAEQGHAWAQNDLGDMYYYGQGVPQDYTEAARWFHLAAAQGYAAAQNNLGIMYVDGQGVPQDDAQAVQWYYKASKQEYTAARSNLGFMWGKGRGIKQKVRDYYCGHENREEAQFCGHCGKPFTPKPFEKMEWDEFEDHVAELFRCVGYQVEKTKRGAPCTDLLRNGKTIAVQIKHSQNLNPTGMEAVREALAGKYLEGTNEARAVTNSVFTQGAKELAQRANVRLINGDMLIKLNF